MKLLMLAATAAYVAMNAGAHAADTLTKIRETGIVMIGARDSGAPLSYTTGAGTYAGYHVELCQRILAGVQRDLSCPSWTSSTRR